jgi:hypothetical protein
MILPPYPACYVRIGPAQNLIHPDFIVPLERGKRDSQRNPVSIKKGNLAYFVANSDPLVRKKIDQAGFVYAELQAR